MPKVFPNVGAWYQDSDTMQLFEIVATDEDSSTIEVQYLDGDIDEYDLEAWDQLHLLPAAAPEDANAGYGSSYSDPWEDGSNPPTGRFTNPLESIEPEPFSGFDDLL